MSDYPPVRKAVVPATGLGTRFRPATKSIPKEMLAVADKPLIAHAFEGVRYNCGSRQGFIRATGDYAREHADLRGNLLVYFETVIGSPDR